MNMHKTLQLKRLSSLVAMTLGLVTTTPLFAQITQGEIEVVAELPIRPGNVAVSNDGRVFATVHPFGQDKNVQLIEVTDKKTYRAWPGPQYQSNGKDYSDDRIDSPLGIYKDNHNRLWIIDMGLHLGKTRIWGFDITSGALVKRIDLPAEIAPKGSFIQDLVVDDKNGWIYLADIANPGLIAVEIATNKARRFGNHPSLNAEAGVKMVIDGKEIYFQGKPAHVAVDPITISADKEMIYFGAMTGNTWYAMPTKHFRENSTDALIANSIHKIGAKPISDGATTDGNGIHYFTNLNDHGIDVLAADGKLKPFVRDSRLDWPDGIQFGPDEWLYISVNQLHKTPDFTGGTEKGSAPFYILRAWTGQ